MKLAFEWGVEEALEIPGIPNSVVTPRLGKSPRPVGAPAGEYR
jgi:hypothetical protein